MLSTHTTVTVQSVEEPSSDVGDGILFKKPGGGRESGAQELCHLVELSLQSRMEHRLDDVLVAVLSPVLLPPFLVSNSPRRSSPLGISHGRRKKNPVNACELGGCVSTRMASILSAPLSRTTTTEEGRAALSIPDPLLHKTAEYALRSLQQHPDMSALCTLLVCQPGVITLLDVSESGALCSVLRSELWDDLFLAAPTVMVLLGGRRADHLLDRKDPPDPHLCLSSMLGTPTSLSSDSQCALIAMMMPVIATCLEDFSPHSMDTPWDELCYLSVLCISLRGACLPS